MPFNVDQGLVAVDESDEADEVEVHIEPLLDTNSVEECLSEDGKE